MFFVNKNTPKVFAKLLGCRCYNTAFSFVNLCALVPNYRTFLDDFAKIIDFLDWYANRE